MIQARFPGEYILGAFDAGAACATLDRCWKYRRLVNLLTNMSTETLQIIYRQPIQLHEVSRYTFRAMRLKGGLTLPINCHITH